MAHGRRDKRLALSPPPSHITSPAPRSKKRTERATPTQRGHHVLQRRRIRFRPCGYARHGSAHQRVSGQGLSDPPGSARRHIPVGANSFPLASSLLVPSYLGNRDVNDARLVQCQHCKEDDGGKDGKEKDSTLFHGIVTPAPIQKIWGIGRLFTHPAGKRKRSP